MCAIWFEDGQWHIRMTSAQRMVFTGSVRVERDGFKGAFQGLEKAKKAKNADWVFLHQDGRGFDFQFVTAGKADGLNFSVGPKAKSVGFKVVTGGDDDPKKVFIGSKGAHPAKGTVTLTAQPKSYSK